MKHIQRNAAAIAAALILGATGSSMVAAKDQPAATTKNPAGHVHPTPNLASSKGDQPTKGTYMTITGEVMDPACFLEAGSKSIGPGHFQCAVDCARSGQTLAIYDGQNDRIYFVAGELPGKNPNEKLMPYIHKKVDVTGAVYHRSEAWGIVIVKVVPHVGDAPASSSKTTYDASNQTSK